MFDPFDHEDPALDSAIARAFNDLKQFKAEEEEYQKALNQVSRLYDLKNQTAQLCLQAQTTFAAQQLAEDQNAWAEEQEELPFYKRISPDTVLIVFGNIFIGLAVIKYEQSNVISSKFLSFMQKI